jgi:hypothetical protein
MFRSGSIGSASRRDVLKVGAGLGLGLTVAACSSSQGLPSSGEPTRPSAGEPTTVVDGVVRAAPWQSFVDSVGVAAHWTYLDTPYKQAERVADLIEECGIRHVRSEPSPAAARLLAARGIRSTFLVDINVRQPVPLTTQLDALRPLVAEGAVVAVEGPNEPDLFWTASSLTYRGQGFPDGVLAWQRELFQLVRQDPQLRHLTVIGPAFGKTYWGGGHPFPAGSLAGVVDVGNLHLYPSGNPFADRQTYAGIREYYRFSDFPSATLDRYPINLTTYRPPFGDRPVVATEAGYSTWRLGQSEAVQARYLPRMYLEHFRLGITRTYVYEFVDEFDDSSGDEREANFGLVRHDLRPKPSFRTVSRLLATARGRAGQVAREVVATITVTPPSGFDAAALHQTTLALSPDTVVVFLWHEVSADDLSPLEDEPPRPPMEVRQPAMSVLLDLGREADVVSAVMLQDDGTTTEVEVTRRNAGLELQVSDRVVALVVRGV